MWSGVSGVRRSGEGLEAEVFEDPLEDRRHLVDLRLGGHEGRSQHHEIAARAVGAARARIDHEAVPRRPGPRPTRPSCSERGNGRRSPLSATISTPAMRPRPRTSPTWGRSRRPSRRARRRSPRVRRALDQAFVLEDARVFEASRGGDRVVREREAVGEPAGLREWPRPDARSPAPRPPACSPRSCPSRRSRCRARRRSTRCRTRPRCGRSRSSPRRRCRGRRGACRSRGRFRA